MRDRHHEACSKPVMLLPASDATCVIRNMHDKSQNFPDPDIFTFDRSRRKTSTWKTGCSNRMGAWC
ncbi:unnamed protein product [Amoebophrya sp. A120]|nr:unnamed protein product [Amoebophrya sp. A120]|eukprot:GSA120T00013000001.1